MGGHDGALPTACLHTCSKLPCSRECSRANTDGQCRRSIDASAAPTWRVRTRSCSSSRARSRLRACFSACTSSRCRSIYTQHKHSKTHPVGASAALTVIDRLPLCEHGPPLLRAPSMSLPPTNVVAYLRFRSFDSHGRRRDLRYADLAHAGVPSSEARGKCTPCNIRTTWRSERTIAEQPRWNRVAGRCTSSRLACGRPLRPPGRGGWSGSARARCKRV